MSYTPGLAAWKLAFQLSPIILTNGLVNFMPGRMLPIIAITEAINFPLGLLNGGNAIDLDRFFANYMPLPGASLVDQEVGMYPFANQAVAANATITQPLVVSMLMVCPAQNPFGYFEKLAIMEALVAVLKEHNSRGGTYIVATPSYVYTNCIMRSMRDASLGQTKQPQNAWQLDFIRPLLTLEEAEQAQNGLFSLISSGAQVPGNPATVGFSGLTTGASVPGSITGVSVIPSSASALAAQGAAGSANALAPFGPTGIGP